MRPSKTSYGIYVISVVFACLGLITGNVEMGLIAMNTLWILGVMLDLYKVQVIWEQDDNGLKEKPE